MPAWNSLLRRARRSRGLALDAIAREAAVSPSSLKAYESGRRHPARPRLTAILDALGASQLERNAILSGAGFAVDASERLPDPRGREMPLDAACAEIHRYRWPAFVVNERAEIVEANTAGRRFWRMDPTAPGLASVERNALAFATDPEVADHLLNWDEAVGALIAAWKWAFGADDPASPNGYFAQLIERVASGDAAYLDRLMDLWERTPAANVEQYRWSYPIMWEEPPFGVIRFHGFAWMVNTTDGIDIDDWIPADADSWLVMEAVLQAAGEAQVR